MYPNSWYFSNLLLMLLDSQVCPLKGFFLSVIPCGHIWKECGENVPLEDPPAFHRALQLLDTWLHEDRFKVWIVTSFLGKTQFYVAIKFPQKLGSFLAYFLTSSVCCWQNQFSLLNIIISSTIFLFILIVISCQFSL